MLRSLVILKNVVDADKSSILFLCDDLDDKCKMMAGLVIGEVPTIVIKLLFVTYLCYQKILIPTMLGGYTVSKSKTNIFGQVTCYTDSGT